MKEDLQALNDLLKVNPHAGVSLGNNIYKVRIAIKSKAKGKSGGARVITYVLTNNKEIYMLTIYDKSELESIDDKTLRKIVADIVDGNV